MHDGGVGEFAARAAEFLGHDERGRADLLAQQRPQRLVVAALGFHRLAHRLRRRVLLDERRDGLAQQLPFFTHATAPPIRRSPVPRRIAPRRAQRLHPQQQQRQVVLLGEADGAVRLQRRPRREQRGVGRRGLARR